LIEISPHVQLTVNKRSPASISKTGRNRKALGVGKSIMSEAKNKSKVGMFTATIIALIIISIIFYFLKYFGVFLGYTLMGSSVAYFTYSLFNKKKTGKIYDILKVGEITYTTKSLQTNTMILFASGLILLGLGSWISPNYDYCECEKVGEYYVLKSISSEELVDTKYDSWDLDACGEKVVDDIDLDMDPDKMNIDYLYEVSSEMCTNGFYTKQNGEKVYNNSSSKISIFSSLSVLYGNMKYKFGWGREEELAELDKQEAELLKNIAKESTQSADSVAVSKETPAASEEVIAQYQINDPDGYTNLRDTPGGSVIKKVNEGDKFELLERGKTYSKVKLSDGTVGFMHNSRIVPAN
jgi:hypothetical protein